MGTQQISCTLITPDAHRIPDERGGDYSAGSAEYLSDGGGEDVEEDQVEGGDDLSSPMALDVARESDEAVHGDADDHPAIEDAGGIVGPSPLPEVESDGGDGGAVISPLALDDDECKLFTSVPVDVLGSK